MNSHLLQATELFIGHLARQGHIYTVKGKRKTIQKRDIDACIPSRDELAFLEGTLE
jgi:histone H3/H4